MARPIDEPTILPPYPQSLAGVLLAAREAVMAPLREHLREAGFTDQQWRVLRVLSHSGPLDAGSIARLALLHPPSVTRIVRDLIGRGLLAKDTDRDDKRRSVIRLTIEGESQITRTAANTAVLLAAYEGAFGVERLDRLRDEIQALVVALEPFAPVIDGGSLAAPEAET
ncbi:MarR family transcriptional regulator [Novosphingobium sp. MMS21-SN21R]|uniref:MarR family transcriptional regulator n=1 Tax=Novosphingobium sp. MMS21-SN21R TaxID=2969298 RepID=UPI002886735D|nr:MarR family transcriptional regulator [Novosphingobium sp. MMS21-SN21R]MDT0510223.1 MarR family transcriptional regulator [Novosphingobium sp. MMS21-SN21R]